MTSANVQANSVSPKTTGRAGATIRSCVLPRAIALAPIRQNASVASMNGAPITAPVPTATLAGSRSTTSAMKTTAVSGNEEPIALTIAPTALRVRPYNAPIHSTALVNASLASTRRSSAAQTWRMSGHEPGLARFPG